MKSIKRWITVLAFATPFLQANAHKLLEEKITVDGRQREYILYLPDNLPVEAPLVLMMHGYSNSSRRFMQQTKMNDLADKFKFAVCYPQGINDNQGKSFWKVGYRFTHHIEVDDINYLTSLIDQLHKEYQLSKEYTFAAGHSNGADMCILLALKKPNRVKAIAAVAGSLVESTYETFSDTATSVLMINGTSDNLTKFTGDLKDRYYGGYLSTLTTLNHFVSVANCNSYKLEILKAKDSKETEFAIAEMYTNTKTKKQVWLYQIRNHGHDWRNDVLNTSEEVWNFFAQFIKT